MKHAETFHQTLAVMTVAFNEFAMGFGSGWTAPVLKTLQLTQQESSWIASLEHFGKTFGVALSSVLLDTVGRKSVLMSSTILFFLIWFGILFTKSVLVICLTRLVFGIAGGLNDGSNSVYLGEVSSPIVRSIFGSVSITMHFLGIFIEFVIAGYLSYTNIAITNLTVTFLTLLPLIWLKEPVQFLLMKGRTQKAEENFMWLKGATDTTKDLRNEFDRIKQNVQQENQKKTSLKTKLTAPANYKSVFIVSTIYSLTGAAGYYPVMSYASLAFSATDTLTSNEFTMLFGVSQLIIATSTSFINGRFNRRPVIIVSFSLAAVLHACTAALYYVHENLQSIPHFSWFIFATITAYAAVFAFVYPTIFLIRAELFPLSIKAAGGCVAIMGFSAVSFLSTKIFLHVYTSYGIHCNFLLFSVVNFATVVFVYFTLPETKNKSLIEIQEILEK